jgi:sugar phosphate isomerase/epimerase
MLAPVTLFTGQWADLPLEVLAEKARIWGYDGLELACWGDHMEVEKAADPAGGMLYCEQKLALLQKQGQKVWAISAHLVGQLVSDRICSTDMAFASAALKEEYAEWVKSPAGVKALAQDLTAVPPHIAEKVWVWATDVMMKTAIAARNLGVGVVNGFVGSPIWHLVYSFPPASDALIEAGFARFAERWNPILDVFDAVGVKFALEVHPTEIAFDTITARRALNALGNRKTFGFNFDPSHLAWQGVDPVKFIETFPEQIFHVHMKDVAVNCTGEQGILGSHVAFGQPRRGWDFRSLGRGQVNFEGIIRALQIIGYDGPLSVEWEDAMMDREHGAAEACDFVHRLQFPRSDRVFDEAFIDKK